MLCLKLRTGVVSLWIIGTGSSIAAFTQTSVPLTRQTRITRLYERSDNERSDSPLDSFARPTAVTKQEEIMAETTDALLKSGWITSDQEELTSDDPFVKKLNAQIQSESGVDLDMLLNPAKVVNLERDLYSLRSELATLTGKVDVDVFEFPDECDGGGGGQVAEDIRKKIEKKEKNLFIERKSVFRGWLKNVFLAQAIISFGLSWLMVSNPDALFGNFGWYSSVNSVDISIKVLGFWTWWLFIIPSLRSRRPFGPEKKALDIAFLGTPALSLLSPIVTKDTELIWLANFALVVGAYIYSSITRDDDNDNSSDNDKPDWLVFLYKSLDFGGGKERGLRQD